MDKKFIFVTGGVCSSLGKGIVAASVGMLLKSAGKKVSIQKLDPYLNVDPGTMSPFQHGEVFVTHDGAETDLDLGHYERFIDENLNRYSNATTGRIYTEVLQKERQGDFLGGTIQVVPHITDAIKQKIMNAKKESGADILIGEIGGTVGDIEGEPFLEAIRQLRMEMGKENVIFIHLTLLPYLKASKELKTKPTQLSARELRRAGIDPDLIVCRADIDIPEDILCKVSRFCGVDREAVIPAPTVSSIFEIPSRFHKSGITEVLAKKLNIKTLQVDLEDWQKMVDQIHNSKKEIRIALAGKYTELDDAYISVIEAIKSACFNRGYKANIEWIDTEALEDETKSEEVWESIKRCAGIIVPGGFGKRGVGGKIMCAKYCRENNVPFFGLCLGSQVMAIEFARNVCGIKNADSEEFNKDAKSKIVHFLPNQSEEKAKGGTLRLGAYPCKLKKDTLAYNSYQKDEIYERHRHRYEFNNDFRGALEDCGFVFSGTSPDGSLVEIVEVKDHPWMLGSQFHPEFLSRPNRPHPLFASFIDSCISYIEK
jgi:CTP synthase